MQQIGHVYRSAGGVGAFIGAAEPGSDIAMQLVPMVAKKGIAYFAEYESNPWDKIQSFAKLLMRPYWTRAWIGQELTAEEKTPLMICGGDRFSFTDLFLTLFALPIRFNVDGVSSGLAAPLRDARRNISDLMRIVGLYSDTIFDSVNSFRATDDRDQDFAFVGLIRALKDIEVDYKKTTAEVYSGAAQCFTSSYQNFNFPEHGQGR